MKVVALDPGGSTGYAVYNNGLTRSLNASQLGPESHHQELYSLLEFAFPQVVVCEDFRYQRGPGGHDLTPVEYIGICKLWTAERRVPLELQGRSLKMLWDDRKIKQLGLWQLGKPHAMDAIRHVLYYVTLTLGDDYYLKQLGP